MKKTHCSRLNIIPEISAVRKLFSNDTYMLLIILFIGNNLHAQTAQNRLYNPVLSMRDGAVERFMGYYYAFGEATEGKIYYSKNLINWLGPVQAVTTNEATWLNDPQWTQASEYTGMMAGDILYRNGVFHTYWNGIGHAYSPTPLGPYKEASISAPFDDYGIDVQVFQDEDGEIYWVKKRNTSDPNPMTGAASNISGPEVWVFKMNSVFNRWDITTGSVQMTHQPGHPTSVNHVNFEGPEMFKYRGKYYIFYASNRMGPRSGMYEVGVGKSDDPMNFTNAKKYPQPVLTRNTEQHLLDYKTILPSAEHGGWDCTYTTVTTASDWMSAGFNDAGWTKALGGFGRQEYDLFAGKTFTNAKIRPRKTAWTTTNIYIRRTFNLTSIPQNVALKHWIYADADFYINGTKININKVNNTYEYLTIDPALLVVGDNVIAVEATSPCSDQYCQQFVDFGLYDTGDNPAEDIVIGPAQPNFVTGPNGFEKWMMYKAYFNNNQIQGVDRIHFYNHEVVVDNCSVGNTKGYRPKPALPTLINYCDYPIYYPFEYLNNCQWKISGGILYPLNDGGGDLLLCRQAETNYRFEVPFRFGDLSDYAGVYAYYKDAQNWLKVKIFRNKTWKTELCVDGNIQSLTYALPDKFQFLESNALVSDYDESWHTLVVYRNHNNFKVELDYFNLTLNTKIQANFENTGRVGVLASSNKVSFDALQYTAGWDEYDANIAGWNAPSGNWTVASDGLTQQNAQGVNEAFKGDSAWNYEFSLYMKNAQLPESGKAGFYPLYVNGENYVRASINYQTRMLEVEGKENGVDIEAQSVSLKKQIVRQYTYESYPTTTYRYDLRNESLISGVNILWFEGNYPYLNQTFALPKTVNFYTLQNGSWTLLNTQLEESLRFSYMNHFTFPAVKTTAIRMVVTNYSGYASRAFSAYFDEEASAGYFLRCRREDDGLHLFVDNTDACTVNGNWGKSIVGLYTENMTANFNGMMQYQSGSVAVKTITINPVSCGIGESVRLTADILPANATNTMLRWESSDPTIVTVNDEGVIQRLKSGSVKITAWTADGGYIKGTLTLTETGLNDVESDSDLKIFPNPATDKLNYSITNEPARLEIHTLTGVKVVSKIPDGTHAIAINQLQNGVYLLTAKFEKDIKTKYFVVSR